MKVFVRQTLKEDIPQIIELSREIYHEKSAWTERELNSHLDIFPEGQFVAVEKESGKIVGMAASLIILWDDYEIRENWEDFTDKGLFTNHDAKNGRTLYGAEVMVSKGKRRAGIGKKLYKVRRELVENLGLLRIRRRRETQKLSSLRRSNVGKGICRKNRRGRDQRPDAFVSIARGF